MIQDRERIEKENRDYEKYASEAKKGEAILLAPTQAVPQGKAIIPLVLSKWTFYAALNYLITGGQGSGKTTFLKSFIRFYPPSESIRVMELSPELNLRYAYPDRNIICFNESGGVSTQDGLDFQKKTSGDRNIFGEIATAPAASWYVQTTKVGSRSGGGTHHANTVPDLISAFTLNIMSHEGFSNEKAVEEMVADSLDIDIHASKDKKLRFIERITEINSIHTQEYPYPDLSKIAKEELPLAIKINELENMKRQTDRETYEYHNLCHYDIEKNEYILDDIFSKRKMKTMLQNMSEKDEKRFMADMEMIQRVAESKEVV